MIRGGALTQALPDENFIAAYATNTRLMGVVVIYIKWQLSILTAAGKPSRNLHQFFYIETTEDGIESYRGFYGEDEEELHAIEQSMLGGLGAGRVPLTMNEAVFLVQSYAEKTRDFGKHLPDDVKEYDFVLRREVSLEADREEALFRKICGDIDTANQLVNYFLMRYFSEDFVAARMLSAAGTNISIDEQLTKTGPATLCRNEIFPPGNPVSDDSLPSGGVVKKNSVRRNDRKHEEGLYVCESVLEDDRSHRIVLSEVGVVCDGDRLLVSSFEVSSMFAISPPEAAMKLARPEYVTVYEIAGSVDQLFGELDIQYAGALQNITEGGRLYIAFNEDNRHMDNSVYLLNDDVKEILYVTVEDQLIIGSYTLAGIKRLENRLIMSGMARQLIEVAKYEFREPILYDYTASYGGDFIRYVEEIMGFEDDEE